MHDKELCDRDLENYAAGAQGIDAKKLTCGAACAACAACNAQGKKSSDRVPRTKK